MLFRVNANRRRRDRGGLGPRNARREKRERSRNTQSTKKSYINRAYTTCSTGKSFELCYQCTQSVGRGATGPLSGALGPSTQIETSTRQHNKSLKQENRNKKSEQRNSKQHSNRNRVPGSPSDNTSSCSPPQKKTLSAPFPSFYTPRRVGCYIMHSILRLRQRFPSNSN